MYFRKKTLGGRVYLQIAASRRVGGQVRQRVVATLGRLDQLQAMTVRDLSPATQQSQIDAVAEFSRHFGCSPDRLGVEQVRAHQVHLAALKRSWSHINQVSCALRFRDGVTLGRREAVERIVSAREPGKLPIVLSADEIVQSLEAVPGLRKPSGTDHGLRRRPARLGGCPSAVGRDRR